MGGIRLSWISTCGIIASLIAVSSGIALAPARAGIHMRLLGLGAGLLFPLSMYIVFTGSLRGGYTRRGVEALAPILAVCLSIAGLALSIAGHGLWRLLVFAGLASLLLHVYLQVRGWGRREPRPPLLYPPIAGMLALLAREPFTVYALAIGLFFSSSMIIVVSLLTLSRNYGTDPGRPRAYTPLALNAAGLALYLSGSQYWVPAAALSLLAYYAFLGLHRLGRVKPIPALRYMVASHILSLATVAGLLASIHAGLGIIPVIHFIYMGFIGIHILLHAPLMIPQVARIRLAKNYGPAPPLLMASASYARPFHEHLSLLLVVLSLITLLIQFRPIGLVKGRRSWLSLG